LAKAGLSAWEIKAFSPDLIAFITNSFSKQVSSGNTCRHQFIPPFSLLVQGVLGIYSKAYSSVTGIAGS
jgi:hypothetical protein